MLSSASLACVVAASCVGRPGLALVDMSVVEQRYRAVLAVLAGGSVTEVTREVGLTAPCAVPGRA